MNHNYVGHDNHNFKFSYHPTSNSDYILVIFELPLSCSLRVTAGCLVALCSSLGSSLCSSSGTLVSLAPSSCWPESSEGHHMVQSSNLHTCQCVVQPLNQISGSLSYHGLQTHSPPPLEEQAWVQSLCLCPSSTPHTPPAQPVSCPCCWSQPQPGSYREEGDFFLRSLNQCRNHSRTRGCVCAPAASGSACTSASPHNTLCKSPI